MENDFNWKAAKLSLCCWCANQSFETCQNWRLKLQGTLPNHRNHSLDKVSRKCVPSIGLIYDNINSNGVGCVYHIQLCLYFSSLFARSFSLCFSFSSKQLNGNSNEFCKVNARQKNVFKYFWCWNSNSGIVTHLCGEHNKRHTLSFGSTQIFKHKIIIMMTMITMTMLVLWKWSAARGKKTMVVTICAAGSHWLAINAK